MPTLDTFYKTSLVGNLEEDAAFFFIKAWWHLIFKRPKSRSTESF